LLELVEIDADATWVIFNPKEYGFYRVNYPESYWNKLFTQLNSDHTVKYRTIARLALLVVLPTLDAKVKDNEFH